MIQYWSSSFFLVAGLVLLYMDFNEGSPNSLSFNLRYWNQTSATSVHAGNDVILNCTTQAKSESELRIKRENDTIPLNVTKSQTVTVAFRRIMCDIMGSYVCEDGSGRNKTVNVGIYNCPPLPCDGDSKEKTVFMKLNEVKVVPLCVMIFPDISTSALFDGETVRVNKQEDTNWSWKYEPRTFNTYTVYVNISNITDEKYGKHNFTISTSQQGQQALIFTLTLQRPGKPECPTKGHELSAEADSVTFSWKPGSANGPSQWFNVFYKPDGDSRGWTKFSNVSGTSENVTGLEANTTYHFRIEPENEYLKSECKDPIVTVKTDESHQEKNVEGSKGEPSQLTVAIIIAVVVVVILIIVVTVVAVIVYKKMKKLYSRVRIPPDNNDAATLSNPRAQYLHRDRNARTLEASAQRNLLDGSTSSSTVNNAGRFVSKEDLVYVALSQGATPKIAEPRTERREPDLEAAVANMERRGSNQERRGSLQERRGSNQERREPRRAKIQNDKVEYITLDPQKSGKLQIEDLSDYQDVIDKYDKIYSNLKGDYSNTGNMTTRH